MRWRGPAAKSAGTARPPHPPSPPLAPALPAAYDLSVQMKPGSDRDDASVSGTGYERNANGPTAQLSSWAQPSGLSLDPTGRRLLVADSESSAVREMDTETFGSAHGQTDGQTDAEGIVRCTHERDEAS